MRDLQWNLYDHILIISVKDCIRRQVSLSPSLLGFTTVLPLRFVRYPALPVSLISSLSDCRPTCRPASLRIAAALRSPLALAVGFVLFPTMVLSDSKQTIASVCPPIPLG